MSIEQAQAQIQAQQEEAGFGVSVVIPPEVSNEKLWEVLLLKIQQPNLFLPVSNVSTRPSDDGLGTYREMQLGW
jgi:hypothetical protein